MAKKKKQIDTSVENMQELLARCPVRVVSGLIACIEAQFIAPDDTYQSAKLEAIAAKVAQAQFEKREKRRKAREARKALREAKAKEAEEAKKAKEATEAKEAKVETPEERQARIKRIAHENTLKRMQFHPFTDFPKHEIITFITADQVRLLLQQCQPEAIADLLNGYMQTLFTGTIAGYDFTTHRYLILELLQMGIHAQILRTTPENTANSATGWLFIARPSTHYIARDPVIADFVRNMRL
ncbi:MAG: hypothetical protein ACI4AM_00850 [Muribaculaceae bacterium]